VGLNDLATDLQSAGIDAKESHVGDVCTLCWGRRSTSCPPCVESDSFALLSAVAAVTKKKSELSAPAATAPEMCKPGS